MEDFIDEITRFWRPIWILIKPFFAYAYQDKTFRSEGLIYSKLANEWSALCSTAEPFLFYLPNKRFLNVSLLLFCQNGSPKVHLPMLLIISAERDLLHGVSGVQVTSLLCGSTFGEGFMAEPWQVSLKGAGHRYTVNNIIEAPTHLKHKYQEGWFSSICWCLYYIIYSSQYMDWKLTYG